MPDPRDEAYGRVTNPERYAVVLDAARELVAELVRDFDVDVITGGDADPMFVARTARVVADDVVRLVPRADGAGGVTFAFTDFPAVITRAGQWRIVAYPHCGCDACDEDPVEVIEQLRNDIEALTAGRVSERWDGTGLHTAVTYAGGFSQSGWSLVEQDRELFGVPREYNWAPW
jgi:hypothetical protein